MTLQNSDWEDRPQVIKGNYGEDLVDRFLEEKGFVIYKPVTKSAHWFDRIAIKNKDKIIIAECKTKARRNNYPDTGINLKHYREYIRAQEKYKIQVYIFFVDEMLGKIYGNFLKRLCTRLSTLSPRKTYPSTEGNIIYFPLELMDTIAELENKQIKKLKSLSTRNYNYIACNKVGGKDAI